MQPANDPSSGRFVGHESGWASPLEKMAKCSQRPNTVADDLGDRQHGHGEDRARNTPHPEPEDERDDDEDGIEGEPSGQKHRRYSLALDQMKSKVKARRNQRLPERVNGQQASEKKDQHAQSSAEDRHIVQQKGHRPPEDRVAHPGEPHRQCHGDTYCRVHDRDRDQIRGDVAFDLLRDFDYLALAAEARQYLDEAVQEDIARHEKEKKKQHRREETAGKVSGPRE